LITDLLIYYLFFEGLFGATPAKFLTETRTVEYNGKLSFGALFKRTLCRFIPFERLAFLFGTRWHDTFSETGVVREEQTGVGAKVYWSGFLGTTAAIGLIYFVVIKVNDYRKEQHEKMQYNQEQNLLEWKVKHLHKNDILFLRNYSTYDNLIYRVERIENNDLDVSCLGNDGMDLNTLSFTAAVYTGQLLIFDRNEIDSTIQMRKDFQYRYDNIDMYAFGSKEYKSTFSLMGICLYGQPFFDGGFDGSVSSDALYYSIDNKGWLTNIVKMEIIKGNVEVTFNNDVRTYMNGAKKNIFTMNLKYLDKKYDFQIRLTNRGIDGKEICFLVNGTDCNVSIIQEVPADFIR
jgi:hypothetical protein